MNLTLSLSLFGILLVVFLVSAGALHLLTPSRRWRGWAYLGLQLFSLVFALVFVIRQWPQGEAKFVEAGHYYTLASLSQGDNSNYTLRLGDKDRRPDYILDAGCRREPCLRGEIRIGFARTPQSKLKWSVVDELNGTFRLYRIREGWFGGLRDRIWRETYDEADREITLSGATNRFLAQWTPAAKSPRQPLEFEIAIELESVETGPRLVVRHGAPRIVELPSPRNYDIGGQPNAPPQPEARQVYLTSTSAVALQTANGSGFVPTITVGSTDPFSQVNGFLQTDDAPPVTGRSQAAPGNPSPAHADFIINSGLTRNGYLYGQLFPLGGERGIEATVMATIGPGRWQFALAALLLWLLPYLLFQPFFPLRLPPGDQSPDETPEVDRHLFVLLPVVQMFLAVRFVLALRTYLWPPYSSESVEGAVLAAVFVPLLVFIGCFATGLKAIGDAREDDQWRHPWWRYFGPGFPPSLYHSAALITLPVVAILLSASSDFTPVRAPGLRDWFKDWLLVLIVPLVVWWAGAKLDLKRRAKARRDKTYLASPDDPFSHALTRQDAPSPQTTVNRTLQVAIRGLLLVVAVAVVFLVVRLFWNFTLHKFLGFAEAVPGALPVIGLRTNLVFELLILALTMRLLASFFSRWVEIEKEGLDRSGVGELVVVFVAPLAMMLAGVFIASRDWGALLVHWPALLGAILLITGLWPLWKFASRWFHAILPLSITAVSVVGMVMLVSGLATKIVTPTDQHSTLTHRILLREGTETAIRQAETGGRRLIEAIEQHWRMLNYASEGRWNGTGYGHAPITEGGRFRQITLSDLVFGVYVLGEHGAFGGLALLALYLFFLALVWRMAWERFRDGSPLRLALVVSLSLMMVFPAIYMAGANLNQLLFTGQDMPLLGLRSRSDVLRAGLILMLLFAVLQPLADAGGRSGTNHEAPGWRRLVGSSFALLWRWLTSGAQAKRDRMREIHSDAWRAQATVAVNLALCAILLGAVVVFPLRGVLQVSGAPEYQQELNLASLRQKAVRLIERGEIWFEPTPPGAGCRGGDQVNRPAARNVDPHAAYRLCFNPTVRGLDEGDTFSELINHWNNRKTPRGDLPGETYDQNQFFRLDLAATARAATQRANTGNDQRPATEALQVNPDIYRWRSPFSARYGWTGALLEQAPEKNDGGALIGAGLALPLRPAAQNEKEIFPASTTPVRLARTDSNRTGGETQLQQGYYRPSRGFTVSAPVRGRTVELFRIETVKDNTGALLTAGEGDFDIRLNGCPLLIDANNRCLPPDFIAGNPDKKGKVWPIRLNYGDVIAYAPKDAAGRVARYVFIYTRAQLGAFSYLAWINGRYQRVFANGPNGEAWSLAQQITQALAHAKLKDADVNKNVYLGIDADLTSQLNQMLAAQRPKLLKLQKPCSWRRLSTTLMETETGVLLALASDHGQLFNPQSDPDCDDEKAEADLNLISHKIGSTIKPFTAAATLRTFPKLTQMTVIDQRSDKQRVFGFPLGGREGIKGQGAEVNWGAFLPKSDNLYAITLSLLGASNGNGANGLPLFNDQPMSAPLRLTLRDRNTLPGEPQWASQGMFGEKEVNRLQNTPLAFNLGELFGVNADLPAVSKDRYDTAPWDALRSFPSLTSLDTFNLASPEKPNVALADVRSYDDLRSTLLGGEFLDLPQYGRVGNAWSNVYLAQSFARIVTGRNITARLAVKPPEEKSSGEDKDQSVKDWFDGAARSEWRMDLLRGLEGVARQGGTAGVLDKLIAEINRKRGSATGNIGDGRTYFTIFSKTGTLDADGKKLDAGGNDVSLLDDSVFVFTAGLWDDANRRFISSVTGAIYFEQGGQEQAQKFAADLIRALDKLDRFRWSDPQK